MDDEKLPNIYKPSKGDFHILSREVKPLKYIDVLGNVRDDVMLLIGIIQGGFPCYAIMLNRYNKNIHIEEIIVNSRIGHGSLANFDRMDFNLIQVQDEQEWQAIISWLTTYTVLLADSRLKSLYSKYGKNINNLKVSENSFIEKFSEIYVDTLFYNRKSEKTKKKFRSILEEFNIEEHE